MSIEFPAGTLWKLLEHYGWDLPSPRYGWQTVKCNAHNDHRASCRVNNQVNAAKCQACDFQGDVISIVYYYEKKEVGLAHALRVIEEITGERGGNVSGNTRFRSAVSGGSRNKQRNSTFVSPRLRGKSTSGRRGL